MPSYSNPLVPRPDPDALVAQLQAEKEQAARGKLRIYFGSNAGVGKTWAMLAAAQRERQSGRRVLVGLVETHGRAETEQQLNPGCCGPSARIPTALTRSARLA